MANQKGDTVSKGHYFNVCTDETNKTFETIYFHTDGEDVEFNDGDDAETKVGAIKGITSDLNTTTEGYAADMTTVAKINSSLGGLKFGTDGDGNYGYYGADGSLIPFSSKVFGFMTVSGLTKIIAKPLIAYGMDMDENAKTLTITHPGHYLLCVGGYSQSYNNGIMINGGSKIITGNKYTTCVLNKGDIITGHASTSDPEDRIALTIAVLKIG